ERPFAVTVGGCAGSRIPRKNRSVPRFPARAAAGTTRASPRGADLSSVPGGPMARLVVRSDVRTLVVLPLLMLAFAAPAAAQWSPRAAPAPAPAVEIAPYAGVLISDDLLRGPFGTAVGPANAPVFGAQ